MAGATSSLDFPASGSALQPSFAGGASDVFLAVLMPGIGFNATYLGGSGTDEAFGLAFKIGRDGRRYAYVSGSTDSSNFPTARAVQPALSFSPEADAFFSVVPLSLSGLSYSTYINVGANVGTSMTSCLSYSPTDAPRGAVAVDSPGNAYVTARDCSPEARGVSVAKIDPVSGRLLYTFNGFGGHAIAVRKGIAPEIFVAGRTAFGWFPTLKAHDSTRRWIESEEGWLMMLATFQRYRSIRTPRPQSRDRYSSRPVTCRWAPTQSLWKSREQRPVVPADNGSGSTASMFWERRRLSNFGWWR